MWFNGNRNIAERENTLYSIYSRWYNLQISLWDIKHHNALSNLDKNKKQPKQTKNKKQKNEKKKTKKHKT